MKSILAVLVLSLCGLVQADEVNLEYQSKLRPKYPLALLKSGVSGKVRLEFNVHNDGSVTDIVALESNHREFANSAIYAASRWRFKPWEASAGQPVVVTANVELYFNGGSH
ncbi:MAG TPA: energy transducer TonB [Pseudomonas sp.]|uniref:energy transducer TonB n=1 Tax=Pseudomonas sp. TaxID=306 RepID=UPI002ED9B4A5